MPTRFNMNSFGNDVFLPQASGSAPDSLLLFSAR